MKGLRGHEENTHSFWIGRRQAEALKKSVAAVSESSLQCFSFSSTVPKKDGRFSSWPFRPFILHVRFFDECLLDRHTMSTVRHSQSTMKFKPASYLPLTPAMLQVLVALADGDKHGYAILKEVSRRSGGTVTLRAGTLYTALQALCRRRPRGRDGPSGPTSRSGRRATAVLQDDRARPCGGDRGSRADGGDGEAGAGEARRVAEVEGLSCRTACIAPCSACCRAKCATPTGRDMEMTFRTRTAGRGRHSRRFWASGSPHGGRRPRRRPASTWTSCDAISATRGACCAARPLHHGNGRRAPWRWASAPASRCSR